MRHLALTSILALVLSAGVAFGPSGAGEGSVANLRTTVPVVVLDVLFADGSLFQLDATGLHKLATVPLT